MVKSIAYTLTAVALCIGLFVFTEIYLKKQFDEFHGALDALYEKIEDETATRSDGRTKKKNCTFLYRTTIFLTLITG